MKNAFIFLANMRLFTFFLTSLFLITGVSAQDPGVDGLMTQVQDAFNKKDIESYLSVFSPDIRETERINLESVYRDFSMDRVSFHRVKQAAQAERVVEATFQVVYQNEYSAFIEMWKLILAEVQGNWHVEKKDVFGKINFLYKLKIPSGRAERVKSIEINHIDLRLYFEDALLFYDNIPDFETALIVIGRGQFTFSPSDPKEQHHLQLLYKTEVLQDTIKYAYLRFSSTFFQKNIVIERGPEESPQKVSDVDLNRAYSLFHRHHVQSFTIESSLDGGYYTVLPQDEQAVFDFEAKKIGLLTYIYSPFALDEVTFINMNDERVISLYSPPLKEQKKRLFVSFEQQFDIKNYLIDLDFNTAKSFLSGRATIELESRVESLDALKLKFNPALSILRIFDEEKNQLFYTQDKLRNLLYVYLIQPRSRGEIEKIEVFYRGKLEPPEQLSDVIPSPQVDFEKASVPPVFQSYLFSQSSYWYPSPPDIDYFQARLRIIVPPQYTCIANGELKESGKLEEVGGVEGIEKMDNSVFVYKTKYPVKYLSFIVGKFSKVEEGNQPLPVEVFISSNARYQNRNLLEDSSDILAFYQGLFGPFPYEKLTVVQRLWETSGGHSPASFIVLNEIPRASGDGYYLNVDSPVDLSRWKEYFLAHEIAHQWWGQGVAWLTYRDQWLSEGLAQFSSILYLKERRGEKVFSQVLKKFSQWTEKKSSWGSITMGSRLSYVDFSAYQSIIYNKSSLALNMLREILGDETFFEGLKEFYLTYRYNGARTAGFIRSMEKVSGQDLKTFFSGWFDSYTLPEVKVAYSVNREGSGYRLTFNLNQLRGHFVFPLWIEWRENGRRVTQKVVVRQREEEFVFQTAQKPEKIKINPERMVPGKFFLD